MHLWAINCAPRCSYNFEGNTKKGCFINPCHLKPHHESEPSPDFSSRIYADPPSASIVLYNCFVTKNPDHHIRCISPCLHYRGYVGCCKKTLN